MHSEFTKQISKILLRVLEENATNPPPNAYAYEFSDWEREMKVQIDYLAEELTTILDKRYRLKD